MKSSDKSVSRPNAKDGDKNGTNNSELRRDVKNNKFSDDKQDSGTTSSHKHLTAPARSNEAVQHDKVSGNATSTSSDKLNPSSSDKVSVTNMQNQPAPALRADSSSTFAQLDTLRKSSSTPNFIKYGLSQPGSRRVGHLSHGQKRKLENDIAEGEDVTPQAKKQLVDDDKVDQGLNQGDNDNTSAVAIESALSGDVNKSSNTNSTSSNPIVEDNDSNNIKKIILTHPRPPGEPIS